MSYIQGFLAAVPHENKQAYLAMAKETAIIFKDYGATQIVESWGDLVPDGKWTDFRKAVQAKEDENVVFSWVVWPDRATYEAAGAAMESDERFQHMPALPFDGKRMMWAGFEPIFEMSDL